MDLYFPDTFNKPATVALEKALQTLQASHKQRSRKRIKSPMQSLVSSSSCNLWQSTQIYDTFDHPEEVEGFRVTFDFPAIEWDFKDECNSLRKDDFLSEYQSTFTGRDDTNPDDGKHSDSFDEYQGNQHPVQLMNRLTITARIFRSILKILAVQYPFIMMQEYL